jgi:hypothetical protein
MTEKWLENFEGSLSPIKHVLRNRLETAGGWPEVAEAAAYFQTHRRFRRDMGVSLIALALMFLKHPVELDNQLEKLDKE